MTSDSPREMLAPDVEARTQVYGRRLLDRLQAHRTSWVDGLEDRALRLLSENAHLRTRALRLVDVLPSLEPGRDDALLLDLARELIGPVAGTLPAALGLPIQAALAGALPASAFAVLARTAVTQIGRRFIVPPGPEATGRVLHRLRAAGRLATFDVVGEAVVGERQARAAAGRYLDLITALAADPDAGADSPGGVRRLQLSLKLSALTPRFDPADPEDTLRRLRRPLMDILTAARSAGVAVTWDVEPYALRDLTWWLFREIYRPDGPFGDWDGAGIVAQAYLRDAGSFVDQAIDFARRRQAPFQVRLVKGAYWDYETVVAGAAHWPVPVFQEKWQTDAQYERLSQTLIAAWPDVHTAIASHNVRSLAHAAAVAEVLDLAPVAVEYQTLFGMDPAISGALRDMGWVARDYVPCGDLLGGMAYLVRRILENTSQVGFLRRRHLDLDADVLLAAPGPGPDPASGAVPALRAPNGRATAAAPAGPAGFVPVSPVPLFDAAARAGVQAALTRTRAAWGQRVPLRIGAETVATARQIVSLSPSHPDPEAPVAVVQAADASATAQAVRVANAGAPVWAALPVDERARRLRRAADLLLIDRDEVAAWIAHEGGKEPVGALADVDEAVDFLRYYAGQAEALPPGYRPRGVVAVIPPWNFPIAIPAGMTSAALATGNAVVLKSAEQTPYIAHRLVEALHRAGVPQEALIHLPGDGETVGQALVESPDVDMIAFTGSREVGRHIVATAAGVRPTRGGRKHVVAEMGGKNAILVFADADAEEAAAGVLISAFGHAGQKCSAAARVLVQRPLFDRLVALLVDGARSLPVGPADDFGTAINPVIDAGARQGIRHWAAIAREEGTVVLDRLEPASRQDAGVPDADRPEAAALPAHSGPEGYTLGPLIVTLPPAAAGRARIAQEEIFGPVLTVIPFDAEADAIAIANGTVYGLTAGVYTRSPARARRVADALQAGDVYVNREITGARVGVEPFGGVRLSGTGPQAGGEAYLYAFVTRAPSAGAAGASTGTAETGEAIGAREGSAAYPLAPWTVDAVTRAERIVDAVLTLQDPGWRERALTLVSRTPELALDAPTLPVPGQHTVTTWTTPRGTGMVVVDDGAAPADLIALVVGALLAGNGIAVFPSPGHRRLATHLIQRLLAAGVPPASLHLVDAGVPSLAAALDLAATPIAFAAVATDAVSQRRIGARLALPWPGQRWIKALLSIDDGPAPAEPGFLRRFALPKTIATRTLRHGADLSDQE